jgi:hypothetical protein
VQHWIEQGAKPSDTAHNLLVREGILTEKTRAVKMPKPVVKEAPAETSVAAGEKAEAEGAEKNDAERK